MLHVVSDPPDSRISYDKTLVDDEREIRFAIVGTLAKGAIKVYRLTWKGRVVPVSASWHQVDNAVKSARFDLEDVTLNGPGVSNYDLDPYTFASDQEHADAAALAVECLLAFGRTADGLDADPNVYGYYMNDERVTLQSFGY